VQGVINMRKRIGFMQQKMMMMERMAAGEAAK
jgi:hypothetical protein